MSKHCVGSNVDERFAGLNEDYHNFCRRKKLSSFITQLTKDTIGWPSSTDFPSAVWNARMGDLKILCLVSRRKQPDVSMHVLQVSTRGMYG